jgi:hypothetical protein
MSRVSRRGNTAPPEYARNVEREATVPAADLDHARRGCGAGERTKDALPEQGRDGSLEPRDVGTNKPPILEPESNPVLRLAQDVVGRQAIDCKPRAVKAEESLAVAEVVGLVIITGQVVRV